MVSMTPETAIPAETQKLTLAQLKELEYMITRQCEIDQQNYHDVVYSDEHRYFKNGFCVGFVMAMRAMTKAIDEFRREMPIQQLREMPVSQIDVSRIQEF
jgi:hypothetical protein